MESESTNGMLSDFPEPTPAQPVGIYGWRKRCVYAFLIVLVVIVVCNIALTVWILRVLHFSTDGMGRLKIVPNGFQLDGEAEFTKPVYVDKIKANRGHPLYVQSGTSVGLLATDSSKNVTSSFVVGSEGVEARCDVFKVRDRKGRSQFMVQDGQFVLQSTDFKSIGPMSFSASVATPTVISPENEALQLLSPNGSMNIYGSGVFISSDMGDVVLNAKDNIDIVSSNGGIHLKSAFIYLPSLPGSKKAPSQSSSVRSTPKVFQLCLCENGKMFLAPPAGLCIGAPDICT